MKSFTYAAMPASAYSEECWRLYQEIHESKGRFDVLRGQHPALLAKLESQALLDNVEASARIDGIYLDAKRIEQLIDGAEPSGAREHQTAGYARALKAFQKDPDSFPIDAATFLAVHTVMVGGPSGKKSAYRQKDYVNMMIGGEVQRVPASPIPAFETPLYLGSACDSLSSAFAADLSRELMMVPTFAVDVMCIKPFDEGTGRLARLVSLLLMEKAGFDVCRFVSVDRLCERHAAAYYEALNACLANWDTPQCDYSPFVVLWLSLVGEAYRTLLALMEDQPLGTPSKSQRVKELFTFRSAPMTKAQVVAALPDVSLSTIENALGALVREGYLEKLGAGRSTAYRRT